MLSNAESAMLAEKAKEIVCQLSPMKYCRETTLSLGIGDGKTYLIKKQQQSSCLAVVLHNRILTSGFAACDIDSCTVYVRGTL